MKRRYSGAFVLVAGALALAAPALAGNPHGAPPGKTKAKVKVSAGASVSAGAHGKGSLKAQAGLKAGVHAHARGTAGVRSTTSATASTTSTSSLAAKAKVYGNGMTADQVAVQSGTSGATLYAVGSSGAHKVLCGRQLIDVHALKAHLNGCAGATLGLSAGIAAARASGLTTSATSSHAKVYGNGMSAAQFALQAGLGATLLFAPGNSQAHLALCGAHMVDVHALKTHATSCAAGAGTTVSPNAAGLTALHTTAATGVKTQSSTTLAAGAKASHGGTTGGVLGAIAAAPQHSTGAVLGATAHNGTLPFTGLALGLPLGLALMLLVSGLGMRHAARTER